MQNQTLNQLYKIQKVVEIKLIFYILSILSWNLTSWSRPLEHLIRKILAKTYTKQPLFQLNPTNLFLKRFITKKSHQFHLL